MSMKVKFISYYKYGFTVMDESGVSYQNEDQDGNSTYRLYITAEMEMEEKDGKYFIDGAEFVK